MKFTFNIEPFIGALPVRFGTHSSEVHRLLGPPQVTHSKWDRSGTMDYWNESLVNVGYDVAGLVNLIGFSPGGCELSVCGTRLWSPDEQPDPNPVLLRLDRSPVETVGFLVFTALGISTTGYHDGDDAQLALTASPIGAWDELVKNATPPDLSRYSNREE